MNKKKKVILISSLLIIISPSLMYFFSEDIIINKPKYLQYKDKNENIILETIFDKPSSYVEFDDIPKQIIDVLTLVEDERFFYHDGIDKKGIIRAFFNNLISNDIQGGSTITQQLTRILYLNQNQNVERKIHEIILARKMNDKISKNKILEYYLNIVYFSHGVYGIKKAADFYFSKSLDELNLYEICMLIGIINAPNLYSPYIDLNASKEKTKTILRTLYNKNYISVSEYYLQLSHSLDLKEKMEEELLYPYYIDAINNEIKTRGILDDKSSLIGYKISSYLDQNIQKKLEEIINKYDYKNNDVSSIIMEVNSGKVVALIGGKDYKSSSFNRALNAKKQIGSTIKPLIYYLGLKKGLTPLSEFTSEKTKFKLENNQIYEVSNVNNQYANRKISMIEAIGLSDNIYALKTLLLVNKKSLISLLKNFNMNVDVDNETIALGSNSLTPIELISIYNTIASNGLYYKPKFIKEIQDMYGRTIYKASSKYKRVLLKKECEILRYLLRAPFDKALKSYLSPTLMNYYISPSYAGKTGSTESSSWVVGFSNKYTILTYLGNDEDKKIDNGYLAKEIFYDIATYLDDKKGNFFEISDYMKEIHLRNTLNNELSFKYIIER